MGPIKTKDLPHVDLTGKGNNNNSDLTGEDTSKNTKENYTVDPSVHFLVGIQKSARIQPGKTTNKKNQIYLELLILSNSWMQ